MVVKVGRVPKHATRYASYLLDEATEVEKDFALRLYGGAAKAHGVLGRPLTLREFQNLADGFTPDGQTRLGRRHRHRQWGFEVLLHVPSGVGKVGEVLSDADFAKLMKAIEKATHDTMRYLERTAARTRVTVKGVTRREPVELLYVLGGLHAKNRNKELSPHAHVLVTSRGRRRNGQWAALENRHFYHAQRAAKRVFNQALAYHITRDLGLKVVRHKETIRVQGVDREWAKTTRREEVKREQRRSGRTDAKGATHATLKTRKPKARATSQSRSGTSARDAKANKTARRPNDAGGRTDPFTFAEVRVKWRDAAHAAGRYAADLGRRAWSYCTDLVRQKRADRCYRLAVKYCAGNVSRFSGQKVDEAAAFFATGRHVAPEQLVAAGERFRSHPQRFGLNVTESRYGQPEYTSSRQVSREGRLFTALDKLEGKKRCGLSDRQIASRFAGGPAGPSAMDAVRRLGAKQGVVAGVCRRPTDPTLRLTVDTYRGVNRPVLAVGQTPKSADRLRASLDVQSHSAGQLVEQLRPPGHWRCLRAAVLEARGTPHQRAAYAERLRRSALKLPRGCVVVTDLGRSHTAELHTLVTAVRQAKGKIIFTGPASAEVRTGIDAHRLQHDQTRQTDQSARRTRTRRAGR